jgi:tellurite resistance protein TehA-like permease
MTRFQRLISLLLVLVLLWLGTWASVRKNSKSEVVHHLAAFFPLIVITSFGLYAFSLLVYGVATFKTVPSEAESLRRDIDEAHVFLRQHKVQTS